MFYTNYLKGFKMSKIVNIYAPVGKGKSVYLEELKFPLDKTMLIDFNGDKAFVDKFYGAKIVSAPALMMSGEELNKDILRVIDILKNEISFGESKYIIIDEASVLTNYFNEVYKVVLELKGTDKIIILASQVPIFENINFINHFNFCVQKKEVDKYMKEILEEDLSYE